MERLGDVFLNCHEENFENPMVGDRVYKKTSGWPVTNLRFFGLSDFVKSMATSVMSVGSRGANPFSINS